MKLKFDKEPESSSFSVGKVAGARGIKYRTTFAKGGSVAKKPGAAVAVMIAMPAKPKGKTKMAMGGCAAKKK